FRVLDSRNRAISGLENLERGQTSPSLVCIVRYNPLMHYFHYVDGNLHAEDIPLHRIAEEVGTPVYVYSERTLHRHVRVFDEAFSGIKRVVCYAVKANSNLSILRRFAAWGTGFEVVSGGELFRVKRAAGPTDKVIFSGVGK